VGEIKYVNLILDTISICTKMNLSFLFIIMSINGPDRRNNERVNNFLDNVMNSLDIDLPPDEIDITESELDDALNNTNRVFVDIEILKARIKFLEASQRVLLPDMDLMHDVDICLELEEALSAIKEYGFIDAFKSGKVTKEEISRIIWNPIALSFFCADDMN